MSLRSAKRWVAICVLTLAAAGLGACGNDDAEPEAATTTTKAEGPKGAASVTMEMKDFSYVVSGPLTASDHGVIEVKNTGTEFHMAQISRMKAGKKISDVIKVLNSGSPPEDEGGDSTSTSAASGASTTAGGEDGEDDGDAEFAAVFETEDGEGGTLLAPGQSQTMTLPGLSEPGEYALICFLSAEGEGTPHFAKGMVGQLTVTDDGDTAPAQTATAEYAIESGKFTGPAALKAGKNVLEVDTKGQHEVVVARMQPGKTFKELDTFMTNIFESEKPPEKGTAGRAPGTIVGAAFGFAADSTVVLGLDLEPGNYVIACVKVENDDDDDDANDVNHFVKEQITVKVT